MAAPSAYTETTLKTYMHAVLGAVATTLEWTVVGEDYDEVLNETLLAYDTDDVTSITGRSNLLKLRTLSRREVWRAVMGEVSGDYDFEDEAGNNKRSQVYRQAQGMFAQAAVDSMVYDANYNVEIESIDWDDPYQAYDEDDDT